MARVAPRRLGLAARAVRIRRMSTARNQIRLEQIERHAEGYLELGMAQHALDELDQLRVAAAGSPRALYLRGEALRELERYREALKPLRKAAKVDPDNTHVWLSLGWCHKRTGRVDLAVKALERALEVEPTEPLLQYNLACYLSLVGNKERALAHLSQALKLAPRYREMVHDEPDFDPIRSDPDFEALTRVIV
jgi:tetratricopeptide (TPR) repeat protein